jgi:HK97 family phage major capsid protein
MAATGTLRDDMLATQEAIESILAAAEEENRELTDEERGTIDTKLARLEELTQAKKRRDGDSDRRARLSTFKGSVSDAAASVMAPTVSKSLGRQFVESDGYRSMTKMARSGTWASPIIDLAYNPRGYYATTLDPTPGSGGPLLVPQYLPGIQPLLFRPIQLTDLFAQGTTTASSVVYMKEKTATNAAAPVAAGAAKPESTLVFEQATDPVVKIATWLPVADEMLEDVPQLESYIDGRLRLFVELTEEDQLLKGTGTPPAMLGLLNRTGILTTLRGASEPDAEAVFRMIQTILYTSFLQPDGIVATPATWALVALSKTGGGDYYGPGPFAQLMQPTLWGYPVVVTPLMTATTVLVGAFKTGAQIFRRSGMSVQASNSHADYFVKNLTAIRAETRLALTVYRPQGFGTVTGMTA